MAGTKTDPEALITQLESMSVLELNALVKHLQERWDVQPMAMAGPMAGGGGAPAAEVVEEQATFDVTLTGFTTEKKIQVIKAIREVTNLGLKDAKDLVEGAPKLVKEGVSKEEAQSIKSKMEAAGGTVELK